MKTKIRSLVSFRRVLAVITLVALVAMSQLHMVTAQEFVRGYGSDESIQRGMVVRLKPDDTSKVEPLSAADLEDMHGVVVAANDAPATISTDSEKTFVAVSGKFEVLVSDQNGSIAPGDYLSISGTNGIAMKADTKATLVVGRSLTSFEGQSDALSTATSSGREIHIGRIPADINIAANPLYRPDDSYVPAILRDFAENISNKPVSPLRLYLALLVLIASAILTGWLLYSGVRGGLVAIGRNPLSRKTITKNIIRVAIVGVIIFACGVFAVYLILKL